MPLYRYKGYGEEGRTRAGTIEAEGPRDAALKLRERGLHPRSIESHAPGRRRLARVLPARSEAGRLASLTRQLSVLLRSGVPLAEALRAASEEATGTWRDMLVSVKEQVVGGARLSRALETHTDVFPDYYAGMVAAGEESGSLEDVLSRLADFMEARQAVAERVKTAMLYPLFMAGVGLLVLGFLLSFVVPRIARIFEDTQAALPLPTVILMGVSDFLVTNWWLAALLAAGALLGGRAFFRKRRGTVHRWFYRLVKSLYLARFARTLGFLLAGGLPMLRALELAGRAAGNLHLEARVRAASAAVSEGGRLSAALEGLPPVLLQVISTGERSGKLPEVLGEAAVSYEAEFDRFVARGLAALEPALILAMGLMVGFVVFSVLLPMFQMNQLVG
jgi:general secretion pathway protein F